MFGLAIIAVGLLFLTFSLIYKCLVARKQRRREAAEVAAAREAELSAQNEVRRWYSFQMGSPAGTDPQPLPPDRPIPFKEPFFVAQPDGAVDVAIEVAHEPPMTDQQPPNAKGGIVIQRLEV